jgi:hypothetical protein
LVLIPIPYVGIVLIPTVCPLRNDPFPDPTDRLTDKGRSHCRVYSDRNAFRVSTTEVVLSLPRRANGSEGTGHDAIRCPGGAIVTTESLHLGVCITLKPTREHAS